MIRCFIAIELPVRLKEEIAGIQSKLKKTGANVSWVKPGNIHLTMKFLGEIPEEKVLEVRELLKDIEVEKVEISAKNVGAFPHLRRPRVIWIGIDKGLESLKIFSRELEEKLSAAGFEKEKRGFKPHLTIGRVRRQKNIPELVKVVNGVESFEAEPFTAEEFILMKSDLQPAGAIYTPLAKYMMK